MTFSNVAQLRYAGNTVTSNVVTGNIPEALEGTKRASQRTYTVGEKITYVLTLRNTTVSAVENVTIQDNLGQATYAGQTLYPMDYEPGSVQVYVNNTLVPNPSVVAGPPLTISGFDIPADGTAMVVYNTILNNAAPLEAGGSITNVATVNGSTLVAPVELTDTIQVSNAPRLTVEKRLSPTVVPDNTQLTYTFVIRNYGNRPTQTADAVVFEDTFNPVLSNLAVTYENAPWAEGVNYTYTGGVFQSLANQIQVPAATFSRAPDGTVQVTPGEVTLTVRGTV